MSDFRAHGDRRAAEIAGRQHGVVAVAQLRAVGLDKHAVRARVRSGRLHALHRGVYAVGHPGISREGRWMAAVLACGEGAVLSHGSAAALWGLLRPLSGPVDVSVPSHCGRRRRAGIRVHRCTSLALAQGDDADRAPGAGGALVPVRDRIPVTTPARTIADLSGAIEPRLVRRATRQAEILGLLRGSGLKTDRTRSDLERDFLRLCRRHDLPDPEVNVRVGRWTVDFLWRERRVAVETDSYGFHRGTVAFEDDHARDLDQRSRGYAIRRFTGRQLRDEPARVVSDLAAALADR